MKRILVIGPGGAGKSTFSTRLGELLRLEVIHLDSLYWKSGWIESDKADWATTVGRLLERETWVMDGNYSGTLASRIAACDTVMFLDLPRMTCIWRVFRRALKYRNRTRPDMAPGCPEQLSLEFMLWIWDYPSKSRPKVLRLLDECDTNTTIIRLRTPNEIERFLDDLRERVG